MPQGAAAPRRYDDPMKAFVATCAIRVEIPWSTSLKEKRAPIRSLVDRFRHRHKTPLIRLHGAESHTWEVLGFTIIGSEAWRVEKEARKAIGTVEAAESELSVVRTELNVDEIDLGRLE